jgi:hypothetical protein
VAAGLAAVALLVRALGLPLIGSQLAGVWVSTAAALGLAWWRLGPLSAADPSLPRRFNAVREIYLGGSSFAAGALYYALLFSDRLIAWTAEAETAIVPLVFRGDYETAVDLGMIVFVLGAGWVHASADGFRRWAADGRRTAGVRDPGRVSRNAVRRLFGTVVMFTPLPIAAAWVIYQAATAHNLVVGAPMERVLLISAAAYALLITGLWSKTILEFLNLGYLGHVSAGAAVAVDFLVGYVSSRALTYDCAIFGFLAGSAVYAAGMTLAAWRACRRFDHAYFASNI